MKDKELRQPDLLQMKSLSLVDAMLQYKNQILLGFVALLTFGVVYAFYNYYQGGQVEKAATALHEAREKLTQSGVESKPAEPGATPVPVKDDPAWQTKAESALKALEAVAKDYKGTTPAFEALLKLGDVYFEHRDFEKAATSYLRASEVAPFRFMKVLALYSLGYAQESQKNYTTAIATFQNALRQGDKSLKAEILVSLGRNYELSGDKTKALEQYNLVATEFPNTPYAQVSELQKSRLK